MALYRSPLTVTLWPSSFLKKYGPMIPPAHKAHQTDEEHAGMPRMAVIPDNVTTIRKMLMYNKRCTYQMVQKKLKIGSEAIHKLIHDELYMKKVSYRWVPHNLTSSPKEERVRIVEDAIQHLNRSRLIGDHRRINIINKLRTLSGSAMIHLQCIPSHVNLKYNGIADDPVKGGTSMTLVNEKPLTCLELYSKYVKPP
ncbi:uncharacterized protein TNCV_3017331 [Trichonephila clavipes]|nr:uncharacterized protein TNCV_3017331 [Trichonephila clavipes]